MKKKEERLKRYYQGTTTVEEERQLKAAWQAGELPQEPILGFQEMTTELPIGLSEKIQQHIRQKRQQKIRQIGVATASIAALLVLILSFRGLFPASEKPHLQLSDNLKKERFEDALRVIGHALEEKKPPVQKVLYEDHNLIITVE